MIIRYKEFGMDTYDLNIAELNALTTLLLNPEKGNNSEIEAIISLSPSHFLTLALHHPHLQDPFYIQTALKNVVESTDQNADNKDFFRHSFFKHFAEGHFDHMLRPYFMGREGKALHACFMDIAEDYTGTMVHLYTITGGAYKELKPEKIKSHLEALSTLDLNKNAPIQRRYLEFLHHMDESVALLDLLLEEDQNAYNDISKRIKVQAAASVIVKDLEKVMADETFSAHSFIKTLKEKDEHVNDMMQGALNLAYSLLIENVRTYGENADLICDALADKIDDIINGYEALYDITLHPPIYQENAWSKLLKPKPKEARVSGEDFMKPKPNPSPTRNATK